MMRQSVWRAGPDRRRRAGVTLIELLVVIAIIAVLMGLLLSAVMRVSTVKNRAETTARFTAINNAVNTLRSDARMSVKYIPPGRFEDGTRGFPVGWYAFRLRNQYLVTPTVAGDPDITSFEAKYIIQVFNRRPDQTANGNEILDLGWNGLRADLDANQTLTFFLGGVPQVSGEDANFTGFATDPLRPFAPRQTSDEPRKGPILDLGGSPRKYVIDGSGFARLTDGYGMPFAYFAPLGGIRNRFYGGYNDPLFAAQGPVAAYYNSSGGSNQYENPEGFQLISSGRDKKFGPGGQWPPIQAREGEDDQANFSPSQLGAGK